MYGWTDPIEPDSAPRRPEPPTDEPPHWLTDRPMPRSSYLFGDEPEQATHDADRPTEQWHREPVAPPTAGLFPHPAGQHQPVVGPSFPVPDPTGPTDLTAYRQAHAEQAPADGDGRHRTPRRLPRVLLIGGAAAAATLVVSLGVGVAVLPGGDDQRSTATTANDTLAAPALPDPGTPPADAVEPASPSVAPTTVKPSPSASRTTRPSPSATRTTAPSRRTTTRSTAPTGNAATTGTGSTQARQVVDLANAERAKAGCRALTIDDKLTLAAQRHSQDQANTRDMSHDGSDGSDVGERLDRVGYAWSSYGENVAWNQQTPAAVMDAWMNSAGHRANILNCGLTEIGVGVATSNGPYWTQVFATPR